MAKDTVGKTFGVALAVCLVCSVLVSAAAVSLRPTQAVNKALDKKRNILMAAGLIKPGESAGADRVNELFGNIEERVIDLSTGAYTDVKPSDFDGRKAAVDPAQSLTIPAAKDFAGIKRRANLSDVYLVSDGKRIRKVILPINGKGLWSTLYGFIALDSKDLNTIRGLVYYEHGETPGLGGEVDNPNWKALWDGKKAFGKDGEVRIEVIKGQVVPGNPAAQHQVDGLSGATITARGVKDMLKYWLGEEGFAPYLGKLREQGVS
ncbi:MAG: Na+-transporting NADH:ubiquinone oxidoreductase subunit C [Candidatus Latescibacterota bacterium]